MSKTAYLARPIDQAHHVSSGLAEAVGQIRAALTDAGYCVYSPADAWRVPAGQAPCRQVEQVNRDALDLADLAVAYLPSGIPSIGVPMEIERAHGLGIPVIVISDVGSYALQREGIYQVSGVSDGEFTTMLAELDGTPWGLRREPTDNLKLVIREGHELPRRAYHDDAGIDLTTVQDYEIEPGQFVDVHTQVDHVQLPYGYWGMITGRSSALRRWRLHIPVAVIDPGWRGPLFVGVWNLGPDPVTVTPGLRLGQLILVPNNPAQVLAVDKVDEAERGLAGFGSTG